MVINAGNGNAVRARITSQGQITVPKTVRDALGARPGDELEFEPTSDGFVVRHRRRRSVLEFAGIAADTAGRLPQTADGLTAMIREGMATGAVARERRVRKAARQA